MNVDKYVAKDPAKAVEWFQKATGQGLHGSLTTLAIKLYKQGGVVPQDKEKAKDLYKAAGFDDLA